MAQQKGSNVRLIYDSETVFKTSPASGTSRVLPYVKESMRLNRNLISSNTIRSSRNPQGPTRGNRDVGGSIEVEFAPQYGLMLQHVFGSTATTGAGPYTHTHKIGSLPIGMTIEKYFGDLAIPYYFRYNGVRVNSFKLNVKPEGPITSSFDLIGCKETVASGNASFDPNPTDRGHTPFDGFECTILEGGTSLAIGTEVSFSIENGIDGNNYVIDGTGERYSLPEGIAKVSGNVKLLFDSVTMYNKALAHSESTLQLTLSKGTGAGSAGNEKTIFYFDELIYKPAAPVVEGPTGLMVNLDFEAYYGDDADASALRVACFDSWATY